MTTPSGATPSGATSWGGYQVLGQALQAEEVLHFAEMGRRIGGILTLQGGMEG